MSSPPSTPRSALTDFSFSSPSTAASSFAYEPAKASTFRQLRHEQCDAVIFDLGDVLFSWSPAAEVALSASRFKAMLRSNTWFEYEKGNMTEKDAYQEFSDEFGLSPVDVADAFRAARESLTPNPEMFNLLRDLKRRSHVSIYAMSNITAPDWEVLRSKADPADWDLFDRVFISADAHARKPDLAFYQHVLRETGAEPTRTVFVDDRVENVLTARSLGLQGIIFESAEDLKRRVTNLLSDPFERADDWLKHHSKSTISISSTGKPILENFAPLLILEVTRNRDLADFEEWPGRFNFFRGSGDGKLTPENFPFDLDTTSIGLSVSTHLDQQSTAAVMDDMLNYRNNDGIMGTYFDTSRPRIDPIVCTNVLTLFHKHGRHDIEGLKKTEDWVFSVLNYRAYLDGTLYYHGPDCFLYFLSRLIEASADAYSRFASLFAQRIQERFGSEGDALGLAMRIIAASSVGLCDDVDYERLLSLQEPDGSWPTGWLYKYGSNGALIGNKALATAFAWRAIQLQVQ